MELTQNYYPTLVRTERQRSWLGQRLDFFGLWLFSRAFTLGITLALSIGTRRRMSHNNGIAARGAARIVDDLQIPSHPLFQPGKIFPCRVRHAAASFMDDAMRLVRGMSVKFADTSFESPFDLEMNTGKVAVFWSAASFGRFAKYRNTHYGIQYLKYYKKYPTGAAGAYAGMRRNSDSFTDQQYYSQTPLRFVGDDKVLRYAKYRVVPFDRTRAETGLPDAAELMIPPENQRILPGETRSRNYLKKLYVKDVADKKADHMLQIQLHTASENDLPEVFNACREWDEATHPWHDLARIQMEEALSWEDSCMMAFSLNNLPESLGVLPAKSIFDYNSLNYLRANSSLARRTRLAIYKRYGVPPEIVEDDIRNR